MTSNPDNQAEVEAVARALAIACGVDLSMAIGHAGGIFAALDVFGETEPSDDPRYREWRIPSCRGIAKTARAAISASEPFRLAAEAKASEDAWLPIETAPSACHVLAARFDYDCGEWVLAFVASPPSKPFTHWRFVDPPAIRSLTP